MQANADVRQTACRCHTEQVPIARPQRTAQFWCDTATVHSKNTLDAKYDVEDTASVCRWGFNHNDSQAWSPLFKVPVSRASVEVTHVNASVVGPEVAVTGTPDMPHRWAADCCGIQRISTRQQMRRPCKPSMETITLVCAGRAPAAAPNAILSRVTLSFFVVIWSFRTKAFSSQALISNRNN